ncbi:MAG TPA: BrnT family toxin [Thermoanaerobaculia bacterium]|nr:BrnT family toxin [Thermoanaerobaculia bacterium]
MKPFRHDQRKALANWRKHRVAFAEAETVFFNDLARTHDDPDHSDSEPREIIVRHSAVGRLLLVVFVEYSDHVRIVNARKTTSFERADLKKASPKKTSDGMRSEYRFDYSKSKPNRFASQIKEGSVVVVLEPDVASVFDNSETVNQVLRSVIADRPR